MIIENSTFISMDFRKISTLLVFFLFLSSITAQTDPNNPNILVILADDMGVDITNGYQSNPIMPLTPEIDALRAAGVTFKNAWATPKCTPTRATIMSGHYGVKTDVTGTPGNLPTSFTSIYEALDAQTMSTYADAFIGKWHISSPVNNNHPSSHGVDHYEGFMQSGVADYYNWTKVTNGISTTETEYVTSYLTDAAITWVNNQTTPWLLWLAHAAPHSPYHVPPAGLYTSTPTNNNKQKFRAAIEAMDTEIGRLFDNIPAATLNNTVVIFLGDNGTPGNVIQSFPNDHAKGSLYQGGVHVPLIVSGKGVTRIDEEEDALVQATDIYATILDIASGTSPGGIYNSLSFNPMLSSTSFSSRSYNYSEIESNSVSGWTIRNEQYKLIEFDDCSQEFYDLLNDELETTNLIASLTTAQEVIRETLENEATQIRGSWSCQDLIKNGTEPTVDDCSSACSLDNSMSTTNIGCCDTPATNNVYEETLSGDTRMITTNTFPDHDYCYNVNNIPSPLYYDFEIDATPIPAANITDILSDCGQPEYHYGIALNGVIMSPAPAAPFIFENPNTGEYNRDWIFEPTNNQGNGSDLVALDCASAHTGPQGYHYHGNMFEHAENIQTGLSTTTTPPATPVHVGWAADGYPILYRFGPDGSGGVALLQASYKIKQGDRPGDGIASPCGAYNGKYIADYEFDASEGDLDECNGITRDITITSATGTATFSYFYVITDDFPQIPRCFTGTPNSTFHNSNTGTVLPLDLVGFELKHNSVLNQIELDWFTENEFDVSHFEIEKSTSIDRFEALETIAATNQEEAAQHYQYVDKVIKNTTVYYRIKIVDMDGSFFYSPIRQIKVESDSPQISVFPNPTRNNLTITIEEPAPDFQCTLVDIGGHIIATWDENAISDDDIFQASFSLKNYPTGIYFLKITTATEQQITKLLKID